MIKEKLLTHDYYNKKLPLLLLNSYGIASEYINGVYTPSQSKIFIDILNNFDAIEDKYFKLYNVMGSVLDSTFNYFEGSLNYGPTDFEHPMLDKVAEIFGVNRLIRVPIYNADGSKTNDFITVQLCNKHLLELIQLIIIKNNFRGTRSDLVSIYKDTPETSIKRYGIRYLTWPAAISPVTNAAECKIYYTNYDSPAEKIDKEKTNLGDWTTGVNAMKRLFQDGWITIESVGITYTRVLSNLNDIGIFGTSHFSGTVGETTYVSRFA